TNGRLVSDVYDLHFTTGGQPVSSFNSPVQLTLPVNNLDSNADPDKFVVGKVADGKVEPVVCKYNATNKQVSTNRNSFSSYVVFENNVEFNDLAAVSEWAGREIEVVAAKGIVEGRGEGDFDPTAQVTRAEFAKMLSK